MTAFEFEAEFKPLESQWDSFANINKYVIVRCDGRGFSKWTRKYTTKPFDRAFTNAMVETCKAVMLETNASYAYAVSDEMTFVFAPGNHPFAGRHQKIVTTIASSVSVNFFGRFLMEKGWSFVGTDVPTFDGRMFVIPDNDEDTALRAVLWRILDGRRNSVQMHAQSLFGHEELQRMSTSQLRVLCAESGHPWEELDPLFRHGAMFRKVHGMVKFSREEIDNLPEKHHARKNPDLEFPRSEIQMVDDQTLYSFVSTGVLR